MLRLRSKPVLAFLFCLLPHASLTAKPTSCETLSGRDVAVCREIVSALTAEPADDAKPCAALTVQERAQCTPYTQIFKTTCSDENCRTIEHAFARECTHAHCNDLVNFIHQPVICDKEKGERRVECQSLQTALYQGLSSKLLNNFVDYYRHKHADKLDQLYLTEQDRARFAHYPTHIKHGVTEASEDDPSYKDHFIALATHNPLLFRSFLNHHKVSMQPEGYFDTRGNAKQWDDFHRQTGEQLEKHFDSEMQAVGYELECWPVHMALEEHDNTIMKALAGRDSDGSENEEYYNTYGLPVFQTEQTIRLGETTKSLPAIEVTFESRYTPESEPFIEIVTAPLLAKPIGGSKLTRLNIKEVITGIPELVRAKHEMPMTEWIRDVDHATQKKWGLSWTERLGWSSRANWHMEWLTNEERREMTTVGKNSFLANRAYYNTKQSGTYCIIQSNTDVFLDQFYTNPYLIQSMGFNHEYNGRQLYSVARDLTKELLYKLFMRKYQANPNSLANVQDPRNYAAGIMTVAIYQALIRGAYAYHRKEIKKNTIQQLIKLPISDMARFKDLLAGEEQDLLRDLVKEFVALKYKDLDPAMTLALRAHDSHITQHAELDQERVNTYFANAQEMLGHWFLKNTFADRYPSDRYNSQGQLEHFGQNINTNGGYRNYGRHANSKLPVELGRPLKPVIKHDHDGNLHVGVVVETRHSYAPFNFFAFWDQKPQCCDHMP